MNVYIGGKYKITITELNHTLYAIRNDKSIERTSIIGYYSSLNRCLLQIKKIEMEKGSDTIQLDEYIKRLEKAEKSISDLLDNIEVEK